MQLRPISSPLLQLTNDNIRPFSMACHLSKKSFSAAQDFSLVNPAFLNVKNKTARGKKFCELHIIF